VQFHGQSHPLVRDAIVSAGFAAAALMDDLIAAHSDDQLGNCTRQTFALAARKEA